MPREPRGPRGARRSLWAAAIALVGGAATIAAPARSEEPGDSPTARQRPGVGASRASIEREVREAVSRSMKRGAAPAPDPSGLAPSVQKHIERQRAAALEEQRRRASDAGAEAAPALPPEARSIPELAEHAWRTARLRRIIVLARDDANEPVLRRAERALRAEAARHGAAMERLQPRGR